MNVRDSRVSNYPPRWNAAPGRELLVIRRNHHTGEVSLDPLRWGLIPYWCKDPTGGRKSINAKAETVASLPTFREAYRKRRCILPVDGFFEWKATKGQRAKQPYAIAMKNGSPFGIAGIWENWKGPTTGEWIRTFAIITTNANALLADIHDRMPVILSPSESLGFQIDEAAKTIVLVDGTPLTVRRFDDRWISAARGDLSYEFDRQNGSLTYAGTTMKEGVATTTIGSGHCETAAGPPQ
jgi:putative SOS response-associated peptidase YedK